MKTQGFKLENGGESARSVLKCGSPLPLFNRRGVYAEFQRVQALPRPQTWRSFAALFCFFILNSSLCFPASAQSYSMDWFKISGGGGTSSGGNYSLGGTIGQPDARLQPMSGANYSLTGGFWALISVVQTAGAPTLYISHSGNTVTVYWRHGTGWNLYQNNNLASPSGWLPDNAWTANSNGTNYLNLTSPAGNLFFRLAR